MSAKQPVQAAYYLQNDQDAFEKKFMLLNQLKTTDPSSGRAFVILCNLIFIFASVALATVVFNSDYYSGLSGSYELLYGGRFNFSNMISHLNDSCSIVMTATLAAPYCLAVFAGLNLLNALVACCGSAGCLWIHVIFGLYWGGLSVFFATNSCFGDIGKQIGNSMSGNLPANGWPYYAGMAGLSLFSALVHYCWSSNKARAEVEQKNLALLMASP